MVQLFSEFYRELLNNLPKLAEDQQDVPPKKL